MIFKIFNSGKGTFSSQFGVLGKSFEDIGSRFKKMSDELISTNDYTISNIVNAWKNSSIKKDLSDKFIITQEDIQDKFIDLSIYDNFNENKASLILKNLQTTNEQVEANATTWDAYLQGFKDQPEMQWQKEFIQTMDIQKATTEDVVKAQNTARESAIAYNNSLQQMTIGAKAANIAMKALAMVGNMVAMYAISKLITAYDDYKKKIHEVAEEASEQAEKSAEYVDKLADLQKELSDGTKSSDELTSAFKEQLKTMGYTSSEIDNLIEKYNGLSGAINEATREALDNAQTDAYVDVASSSKALTLDAYGGLTKDIFIQSVSTGNTDLDKEISKMLSSVASKSADQGKAWISKDNSAEGLYEYYNVLKDISQLIQQTAKETDNDDLLNLGSMFNTTMYGEITEAIDKLKDSAEEYGEAINRLNSIDAQIELADYLKTNDIDTQEAFDAYISGIQNSTDYSETYKKVLIDVANNAFPQFVNAVKNADTALSELGNETPISFVKSMTEVEKSKTGFDLIDKIYADVKNKEEFDWTSILNNTSFTETFGNMENVTEEYKSVYDEFIETVSNSPSDIDKCQKAFNRLTTAYLQNEGTLSAITDQSKEAAILYLQEQGVVNATEVVYASLLKTKLESEEASIAVANGTASEINSLLTEGAVTEETAQKLAAYALHKSLVNTETIDTAADCENVMRLAKVAGASVEALSQLDALKQRLADNPIMSEEMRKTITNKIKSIVSDVESSAVVSIDVPEVDYKGGSTTQKAADSAKKTADDLYNDLKEQIDAYMDYMEKSLDAGKIDYNTYCSSVKNYLDDLYNSGKLKAKDYFDYTEKMLNKQKDIYDKVISAVVDRLEEEVDKWQEKIDELESVNDKLNDNLSNMDSALDAIDRVYDKEIDRIQAIIDGLKDANDERDRTLALEKAKYELEKAYSQKIKKLYVEGKGYIYTPDYDAIKDAQSSYDDAELDLKTSELQKQIDTLTNFKSKWDDVKNAYQYNIDEMNAAALLGSEYQKLILNNNILDVENFKNQYVGIQQQINSNEELIKSYNEKVDYYNKLKEQWQSISNEYDKQRNAQYASQVLGANWENDVLNGRLSTLDGFRTQYISVQQAIADAQWQSANEQIKALQALADAAWASANEQINAAKEAQKAASGSTGSAGSVGSAYNVSGMISAGAPTSVINKITGNKSNTSAAATADQRKNNSNIIMSNEQKKTIAASKKRANNIRKYAKGGVVKINPDDLLTGLAKQHGEDGFAMVQDGERILTQQQTASFDRFVDLITGMNVTPQMLMPDFTRFATGNSTDNSSVIVNIGDINLQGVQNAEQLGDAIIKRLPGYITQRFNNKQR